MIAFRCASSNTLLTYSSEGNKTINHISLTCAFPAVTRQIILCEIGLCRSSPNRSDGKHSNGAVEGTHSRPESGWWGAVFPGLTGAVPHHLTVDGTADTVVKLHIQFGQNISCRKEKGSD